MLRRLGSAEDDLGLATLSRASVDFKAIAVPAGPNEIALVYSTAVGGDLVIFDVIVVAVTGLGTVWPVSSMLGRSWPMTAALGAVPSEAMR